jgi:hypothetical protein
MCPGLQGQMDCAPVADHTAIVREFVQRVLDVQHGRWERPRPPEGLEGRLDAGKLE